MKPAPPVIRACFMESTGILSFTLSRSAGHQRRDSAVRQTIEEVLGALCHELNNPLAAASMGVELAIRRGNLPAESARDLDVARGNLDRIGAILLDVRQRFRTDRGE